MNSTIFAIARVLLLFAAAGSASAQTCYYELTATSSYPHQHGYSDESYGYIGVLTQPGCAWTAQSGADWITTSSSGVGHGNALYFVAPNPGQFRSGQVTIAGQTFGVYQDGAPEPRPELIDNGGFEAGSTGWQVTSSSGTR